MSSNRPNGRNTLPPIQENRETVPKSTGLAKNVFARFARLNVEEQDRRVKEAQSNQRAREKEVGRNTWLNETARKIYDDSQLDYAIPYRAEYQCATGTEAANGDNPQVSDGKELGANDATAAASESDTVSELPTIRGLKTQAKRSTSTHNGSVLDFELTSTVLPPSEGTSEEYTSNIDIDDLRKDFFANYSTNKGLPIYHCRANLINTINSYSISIIEGATGCGKTTQVPTYILEDAVFTRRQQKAPVIYVTQPRRIAAKSIAQRVCDEHGWSLGTIVGYQVGLEKMAGSQTVLVFCTAGVLLQKLIHEKSLKNYSHIIIDEVHERDADTDLLLMMIRALMRKEMSFFRLIVMSATMEMEKLKDYFTFKMNIGHKAATPSVCKISQPAKSLELQVMYFDNLRSSFQILEQPPPFEYDQPEIHDECYKVAVKIIVDVIPHLDTFNESSKSTLVFLPGLAEINKLHQMLKPESKFIDIIPLHSCISAFDQSKVFLPPRPGCRKVILATNIAESSITVREVGFIIDFCLTKTLIKDPITRFPTLRLQWSTKDKSTQRAGRTGRCCPGKVFRMVTSQFYKDFPDYAQPELLTAPLELSVLRVKNFQMGELRALFAIVLDPPPMDEIRTAVLELKQIGALSSTYQGKVSDIDGDLTELGKVLSSLPIDVHLSKLIVIAAVLDVLEGAIIVAACLSTNRTVVKHSYGNLLESYENKLKWANGSYSDLFVSLDCYREYAHLKYDKNKSAAQLDRFCQNRNLDEKKLHEVSALIQEITSRLDQLHISVLEQPNRTRNIDEDELMLKIAFCAAFYPNYFLSEELDARDIQKQLGGFDPTKTLIIHNLPINQVPLYRTQIVDQLDSRAGCKNVDYIADHSRALILVKDVEKMPQDSGIMNIMGEAGVIESSQDIKKSIYMSIKFAEGEKLVIREYREEAAYNRMKYYRDKRESIRAAMPNRLLPAWMKILKGGTANNRRIIEATNEEYVEITNNQCYFEVDLNEEQESTDLAMLYELETREEERLREIRETKKSIDEIQDEIFKPETRFVRGPISPIRMSFRSVLEKSKGFSVDIDPHSINSILLDPEYEKKRRQMLVAAGVTQSKRAKVVARDTTLMPNIRGLPTIMALLFAQYYRVVYNEPMKCIAGAIFGIGWDENDEPIDSQYEVELNFDVHINGDDIGLINRARSHISNLIKFLDIHNPGAPRAELQTQLRQIILTLMRKRRFPMSEVTLANVDWDTNQFIKDKHNVPQNQLDVLEEGGTRIFLPLMTISRIYTELDMLEALRLNQDQLKRIEDGVEKTPMGGVHCLLCGSGQDDPMLIYSHIVKHLDSEDHLHKLRDFEEREAKIYSLGV